VGSHVRYGQPSALAAAHLHWLEPGAGAAAGQHAHACHSYVEQQVRHLYLRHQEMTEPALHLRRLAGRPWWRSPTPPSTPGGPLVAGAGAAAGTG
jgi:hypothetical protein